MWRLDGATAEAEALLTAGSLLFLKWGFRCVLEDDEVKLSLVYESG